MNKINKPWGYYVVLDEGKKYIVKKIVVYEHKRLSLQYHNKRKEYWTIVAGKGVGIIDNHKYNLIPGDTIFIPTKIQHRIEAKTQMEIIEVQMGECCEDDIVRIEDDFGRIKGW